MPEEGTTQPICPPHHWLITEQGGTTAVQIWTCRRCATRKEVPADDSTLAAQGPNAWRSRGAATPTRRSDSGTTT